jgi:hypothetical protein
MITSMLFLSLAAGCAGFAPAVPRAQSMAPPPSALGAPGSFALWTVSPASLFGARSCTRSTLRRAGRGRASGLQSLNAMFTGIVEEMGKVSMLKEEEMNAWDSPGKMVKGVTLTVDADVVLEGAYEGCSIAVSTPVARMPPA